MNLKIMTVDLEPDLRSAQCQSMEIVVPKLLDFFDSHKIKATFFTVTSLLEKYESEIKEIAKKHEISSHSHTHPRLNNRNAELNNRNAEFEIKTSKEKLKEYGINCLGFRAPRAIITQNHFQLLKKYNYQYDSSLATFFPGRYCHLNLPKRPFMNAGLLEFPIPNFVYPSINSGLSYLKLFHPISKLFPQQYLFYLHPWEFMEKKELPPANKSFVKMFLRRNSGKKAWKIFEEFVDKGDTRREDNDKECDKKECKWVGCKEWMKRNRF
ncbi:MAG: polysaccharide deacetylase family protein [Nanoarchaeota archaeon]